MKKNLKTLELNENNFPDELNPRFLFSTTANELLCDAVNGKIDLVLLAKIQLANRGYNAKNEWVGFDNAWIELGLDKLTPEELKKV